MGVYVSDNLIEVLQHMSTTHEEYRMASDLVYNAYRSYGMEGVKQVAVEHGINYTLYKDMTTPAWFSIQEVSGATEFSSKALYPSVLETSIDVATDELVVETAKQVTTKNGLKTFLSGGAKALTEYGNLVGAIATGAQLGWESYKEHPDFWTDFSDAMFYPTLTQDTPIEVLARAHSGGYTTAVKQQEVCKILQGLAKTGCFDYREYTSEITEVGYQDVTISEIYPIGEVCGLAYQKAKDLMPNCVSVVVRPDHPNHLYPNKTRAQVVYANPNDLPTYGYVAETHDAQGRPVYSINISAQMVMAEYDENTSSVTYTTYPRSTYSVWSGKNILNEYSYDIGGLNVDTQLVLADNELFPNDHTPNNLVLAPDCSISDVLTQLREKFSDWIGDSFTMNEYNPETGTVEPTDYLPVTIPWWNSNDNERPLDYTPSDARKGDVKEEPDARAKPQAKEITKNNPQYDTKPYAPDLPIVPPTDTPPDSGGGAGGTSNALWSVYNPTLQELNDLGAYLWTNNIVDLLEKFLQNPMDAIISLHKIYCQPDNGARQSIALGYLDSGVSSLTVSNQFKTIDCGSIDVPEYFSDARDYDTPYTIVECYLPFVGIVRLRTADIIGGKVNIVYTVDVYSGACLCKVFVTKLGAKQLLYNFSGNCSMQIPLTGADRTRLLSGAITGAVTGAFAGAEVGAVAGAVMGAFMGGTSIDRTSGFSANAGCMGVKKPYLIVTRKYSYDAGYYNKYYGFPSNITVTLGSCKGFTRVKSVHIENLLRATDNEKAEIEILLKEGVIIN